MTTTTIPIKNFRENLAKIADQVEENGVSFLIIRNSKPSFLVIPIDEDDDIGWETVIDFTEGGKKEGLRAEDALKILQKINREKDG